MKTEPQRICPSCGNERSEAMEFCPVCMLCKGLAGGVESGESSASEDTIKPTAQQAAQRFEHYELVTGEDGKPVELGRGAMGQGHQKDQFAFAKPTANYQPCRRLAMHPRNYALTSESSLASGPPIDHKEVTV